MKQFILLSRTLLLCAVFTACHKSNLNYEKDFNKSYKTWLSFKETSGNSYQYTVGGGTWTGIGWDTEITVKDGKVSQRHYQLKVPNGYPITIPAGEMEWTEDAGAINTHTNSPAAAPLTLDEIYDKARTEWLVKRSSAKVYFEARNNGLLSSAGYVPDGCQDDCFRGITITSIKTL